MVTGYTYQMIPIVMVFGSILDIALTFDHEDDLIW